MITKEEYIQIQIDAENECFEKNLKIAIDAIENGCIYSKELIGVDRKMAKNIAREIENRYPFIICRVRYDHDYCMRYLEFKLKSINNL